MSRGQAGAPDHVVHVFSLSPDAGEDPPLVGAERRLGGGRARRRQTGGEPGPELGEDVLHAGDERGALLDQPVRAPVTGPERPRHGEHLPPLLRRMAGGDERAALLRGLDHDRASREAADQPVAPRKVEGQRRRAARELAHERPVADDLLRQPRVPGGIDAVDAGAEHGDRAPARRERAAVRRGVDAGGETAHHRDAGTRELAPELLGHPPPVLARAPRADHGDRQVVLGDERAAHGEDHGRVGDLAKPRRIGLVRPGHERGTHGGEPRGLSPGAGRCARESPGDGRREPRPDQQLRRRGERRGGRAEARDQLVRLAWREFLDHPERKPGERVAGEPGR